MKQERNIALAIVFSIITCGIYSIYWFIVLSDDVKEYSQDQEMMSGGIAFLLNLITCGIFGLYWVYKLGKNMGTAQQLNGLPFSDNSVLYLVLQFFGLGIINYCIIQNDLNAITRVKNGGAIPNPQAQ